MKREEPIAESPDPTGLGELWREAASGVRVHGAEVLLIGAPQPRAGVRPVRAPGLAGLEPPRVGLFWNAAQRGVVNSIQG